MKKMELYKTIWLAVGGIGTIMLALSGYFVPYYSKKINEAKVPQIEQPVKKEIKEESSLIDIKGDNNEVDANKKNTYIDKSSNKNGNSIVGEIKGDVHQSQINNYGNVYNSTNYINSKSPRTLSSEDIGYLEENIPLDYKVVVSYINCTEESISYAQEIISQLKSMGYHITAIRSIGMMAGGKPYSVGERYYVQRNISQKEAEIIIREQK